MLLFQHPFSMGLGSLEESSVCLSAPAILNCLPPLLFLSCFFPPGFTLTFIQNSSQIFDNVLSNHFKHHPLFLLGRRGIMKRGQFNLQRSDVGVGERERERDIRKRDRQRERIEREIGRERDQKERQVERQVESHKERRTKPERETHKHTQAGLEST